MQLSTCRLREGWQWRISGHEDVTLRYFNGTWPSKYGEVWPSKYGESQMSQGFQGHWQMQLQLAGPFNVSLTPITADNSQRTRDTRCLKNPSLRRSSCSKFRFCTAWVRFWVQVEVSTLWKVCPRKNHLLATFVQTKPGGQLELGDPRWVSSWISSGNDSHNYWKWPIYSGFSHWTWWFSTAMLNYQRVTIIFA